MRTQPVFYSNYFLARVSVFAGVCEIINVLLVYFLIILLCKQNQKCINVLLNRDYIVPWEAVCVGR